MQRSSRKKQVEGFLVVAKRKGTMGKGDHGERDFSEL